MERMEKEQIFVLHATKQDTGLEIDQRKTDNPSLKQRSANQEGKSNQQSSTERSVTHNRFCSRESIQS